MESLLLGSDILFDAVVPFLHLQDLLKLGQVSKRFHTAIEDFFSESFDGKEGYFYNSCKRLCSGDVSTLAGLLRVVGRREGLKIRSREERRLFCMDEWPSIADSKQTASMLMHFHLPSWRAVCLRLLDRIQSIEQRRERKLEFEQRRGGRLSSLVPQAILQRLPKQLIGEPQKQTLSAFFVTGSGHIDTFYYFCFEMGLSLSDVERLLPTNMFPFQAFWKSGKISIQVNRDNLQGVKTAQHQVTCSIIGAECGPVGYEPQLDPDLFLHSEHQDFVQISFASSSPDFLIWALPADQDNSMDQGETPYGYPNKWKAHRVALREFILARGCPCKVLLVLVVHDGPANPLPSASTTEVEDHLRMSSLSKFGIQWRVQECRVSAHRLTRPGVRMLQGASEGLEWAVSCLGQSG